MSSSGPVTITDKPSVIPGTYWFRRPTDKKWIVAHVYEKRADADDYVVGFVGERPVYRLSDLKGDWYGPLPRPPVIPRDAA